MQSIIDALKNGDAKARLAIVADIVSILGVSLATLVGGSFALSGKLDVENIVGVSASALLSLAGASLVVLAFLASSSWLRRRISGNPIALGLLQFSLWDVFGALFLLAAFFSYEILTNMRYVSAP
jgi:hypothetical protein